MPTYVYETIPSGKGTKPRTFELKQSMKDDALTHDPETGDPVHRVVSGGYGFVSPGYETPGTTSRPSGGCGSGCGCGA